MKRFFNISLTLIISVLLAGCYYTGKVAPAKSHAHKTHFKARDYYLSGLYLQQEGRYNEALVQYYQALHHDSSSATIYATIAENHMKLGHYESAQLLLKKALSLNPDMVEALSLLAECDFRLGQDDKAIENYRKLLDIDPYNDDARQYLILLYEKNGDDLGVARQNEELLQIYGKSPGLLRSLARIYLKNKDYDKALFYFNEALQIDSTDAQLYLLKGNIELAQSKNDAAIRSFEKAVSLEPLLFEAVDKLTVLYRSEQRWQNIIDLYQPILKADSSSHPARVLMAESYFYLDQHEKARQLLKPITDQEDVPLSVLELLGRIELESKNYQQAEASFRKIIEQDKENKYAWLFLGFTYADMDQQDKAAENYQQALELFPEDAMLWSFYGVTLQQLEKNEQAVTAFLSALKYDPKNKNALTNLPVVYETLGAFSKVDSLYELGLQLYPDDDLLLNNYSYSLSERNIHLDRALEMARKAVQAKPENAAYLDTIGWIYFQLKDYRQAEKYIKKAVDLRANSPVVLEHLGDVYAALGNIPEAIHYWQKSLELDNDNLDLKKKLENIQ